MKFLTWTQPLSAIFQSCNGFQKKLSECSLKSRSYRTEKRECSVLVGAGLGLFIFFNFGSIIIPILKHQSNIGAIPSSRASYCEVRIILDFCCLNHFHKLNWKKRARIGYVAIYLVASIHILCCNAISCVDKHADNLVQPWVAIIYMLLSMSLT